MDVSSAQAELRARARFPTLFITTTPGSIACIATTIGSEASWFPIALCASGVGLVTALLAALPELLERRRAQGGRATRAPTARTSLPWAAIASLAAVAAFALNLALHWGRPASDKPLLAFALCLVAFASTVVAGVLGTAPVDAGGARGRRRIRLGHGSSTA